MSDDTAVLLFVSAFFIGAALSVAVFIKLVAFFAGII